MLHLHSRSHTSLNLAFWDLKNVTKRFREPENHTKTTATELFKLHFFTLYMYFIEVFRLNKKFRAPF